MDESIIVPIMAFSTLFIGLPWLIFHYITKWKQAATLTVEDENLLDELHDLARRLDERMNTIERIVAADHGPAALTRPDPAAIAEFPRQALRKER